MKFHPRYAFLTLITLFFLYMIFPFLQVVAIAGIIAALLHPLFIKLSNKFKKPRRTAIALTAGTTLLVFIPATALIILGIKAVSRQIVTVKDFFQNVNSDSGYLSEKFPGVFHFLQSYLDFEEKDLITGFRNILQITATKSASIVGSSLNTVSDSSIAIIICLLGIYFLLMNGTNIASFIRKHSVYNPTETKQLTTSFSQLCRLTITATIIVGLAQSSFFSLGCIILGVSNVITIWFLVFCMSFIPVIGTTPITFGIAIFQLASNSAGHGITLLVFAILTSVIDNLLRPLLFKGKIDLHPFLAFIGIFGGLWLFGFLGVFLGPIITGMLIEIWKVTFKTSEPV